jgi:hypothetical protein
MLGNDAPKLEARQLEENHREIEIESAVLAAIVLNRLLAKIRDRFEREHQQNAESVEISLDNRPILKAELTSEPSLPQMPSLPYQTVAYLEEVISLPEKEQQHPNFERDVTVAVNQEEVFRLKSTKVELNKLPPARALDSESVRSELSGGIALTTTGESLKRDLEVVKILLVANRLVQQCGRQPSDSPTQFVEGKNYLIAREGENISVLAKDGRGEILSLRGGRITNNLSPEDLERFKQIAEFLDHLPQLPNQPQHLER